MHEKTIPILNENGSQIGMAFISWQEPIDFIISFNFDGYAALIPQYQFDDQNYEQQIKLKLKETPLNVTFKIGIPCNDYQ